MRQPTPHRPEFKINDDNLSYVHRALLEAEYMALRERRNTRTGIVFMAGLFVGIAVTGLIVLWPL
jgi:hypothetical protein